MVARAARYEASVVSLAEQLDEAMNTLAAATDDIGAINTSDLSKAQHVLDLASTTTRSIQAVAESTEDLTGSASHISAQVDEQARMGAEAMAASDWGQISIQALRELDEKVSEIVLLKQQSAAHDHLLE